MPDRQIGRATERHKTAASMEDASKRRIASQFGNDASKRRHKALVNMQTTLPGVVKKTSKLAAIQQA